MSYEIVTGMARAAGDNRLEIGSFFMKREMKEIMAGIYWLDAFRGRKF
jgi:hypothetical protein